MGQTSSPAPKPGVPGERPFSFKSHLSPHHTVSGSFAIEKRQTTENDSQVVCYLFRYTFTNGVKGQVFVTRLANGSKGLRIVHYSPAVINFKWWVFHEIWRHTCVETPPFMGPFKQFPPLAFLKFRAESLPSEATTAMFETSYSITRRDAPNNMDKNWAWELEPSTKDREYFEPMCRLPGVPNMSDIKAGQPPAMVAIYGTWVPQKASITYHLEDPDLPPLNGPVIAYKFVAEPASSGEATRFSTADLLGAFPPSQREKAQASHHQAHHMPYPPEFMARYSETLGGDTRRTNAEPLLTSGREECLRSMIHHQYMKPSMELDDATTSKLETKEPDNDKGKVKTKEPDNDKRKIKTKQQASSKYKVESKQQAGSKLKKDDAKQAETSQPSPAGDGDETPDDWDLIDLSPDDDYVGVRLRIMSTQKKK